MMILAIAWGTVPTWALFVLAIGIAIRVSRGGGGSAVGELSKANEVLDRRHVHDVEALRAKDVEIATLRAQTDVAIAIEPVAERIVTAIAEHEQRALGELTKHEERAIERHEAILRNGAAQLNVIELVAERLGPEPNGQ